MSESKIDDDRGKKKDGCNLGVVRADFGMWKEDFSSTETDILCHTMITSFIAEARNNKLRHIATIPSITP